MNKKHLLINVSLSFTSVFVSLILLEVGLRIYDRQIIRLFPESQLGTGLFETDPLLGWRNKASFATFYSMPQDRFRNHVKTNSHHFRDDEYSYDKPSGTKRILLLGDSVVEGLEVERHEVMDVQLEMRLAHHGHYEVINAGVQGYGTDQQYLFLKDKGFRYEPDIVIHVAVYNDPAENISIHQGGRQFSKAFFEVDSAGALILRGIPIPTFKATDPWVMPLKEAEAYYNRGAANDSKDSVVATNQSSRADTWQSRIKRGLGKLRLYTWLTERVKRIDVLKKFFSRVGVISLEQEKRIKPESITAHEHMMHYKLLEAMNAYVQSISAKFLVYEFTNGMGEKPELPTDVQRICQKLRIAYHNSFDEVFEHTGGEPVYAYRYDMHWNAQGHKAASDSIYRVLVAQGWVE
jgi:lysophospholipase L1-like esterase